MLGQVPDPAHLATSRPSEAIAAIIRTKARTFSFAARFLPEEERNATTCLYAFFRTLDDLVDEPPAGSTPHQLRRELDCWRQWLERWPAGTLPDHALAEVVHAVIHRHQIPPEYLLLLLDGMESDLAREETETWPRLRGYCFRVASTVGLAMCHVLGAGGDALALQAAAELGVGMQLTNILRDVGSDLRSGRVYLPADELARHGYSRARLQALAENLHHRGPRAMDECFRELMAAQIERARGYYERGLGGVWRLAPRYRFPVLLAGRLYAGILDAIEAADYDVFTRRVHTGGASRLGEAARCWARARVWGAPAVPLDGVCFRLEDWRRL